MKGYAIANQKGGVAKTTSGHNLAAGIFRRTGKKTLICDCDPQGNMTLACGHNPREIERAFFDFLEGGPFDAVGIDLGYADLIPANLDSVKAESWIQNQRYGRQSYLANRVQELERYGYDYVFYDCPGNLGFVTVNAMVAAKNVLVPLQCEYYGLEGLSMLFEEVQAIRKEGKDVNIVGIIPTMWDKTTINAEVKNEVRRELPELLYETKIRRNVRLNEAPSHGKHIFEYDPECNGSQDYEALVTEFLRREA